MHTLGPCAVYAMQLILTAVPQLKFKEVKWLVHRAGIFLSLISLTPKLVFPQHLIPLSLYTHYSTQYIVYKQKVK